MNISAAILDLLKKHSTVAVKDFGIFSLGKTPAALDSAGSVILPPAKQVLLYLDYGSGDHGFIGFLSKKYHTSPEQAENELKIQTDFWRNKIQGGAAFEMPPLGSFSQNNEQLEFTGSRLAADIPDFYGLEEIKLSEIRPKPVSKTKPGRDYMVKKSILYSVLLALPVLGILAAVTLKSDVIFGKKSFPHIPAKTSSHVGGNNSIKIRNTANGSLKTDSVKRDSVKKASPVAKKRWAGTKKSHSINNRKSKWTKRKWRANR